MGGKILIRGNVVFINDLQIGEIYVGGVIVMGKGKVEIIIQLVEFVMILGFGGVECDYDDFCYFCWLRFVILVFILVCIFNKDNIVF